MFQCKSFEIGCGVSAGGWAACAVCAPLVREEKWGVVAERALGLLKMGDPILNLPVPAQVALLRSIFREFVKNKE